MGMIKHSQSTQSIKLAVSLQYLRKEKVPQLLLCSIVMENIQIFYGDTVIFVAICWKNAFGEKT